MKEPSSSAQPTAKGPIEWMRWVPVALLALVFLTLVFIGGRVILVPLLISLALAYLLAPVVRWFERRGWSRSYSVLLTLTAVTLSFILILIFILPSFWEQVSRTYEQARTLTSDQSRVEPLLDNIKQVNPQLYDILQAQLLRLKNPAEQERLRSLVGGWLQSGLFKLVDLTASILDLLLIPFFVYYLLADYRAMRARIDRLIPPRYRPITAGLFLQINNVISSYVRSQLLIGLTMGVLYSIGFAVFRVPLAITIGMLSGLLNFVPYLGTLSGLVMSLSFVALDGAGWGRILGVLVVFIIVQSVEGYYLTPKYLGGSLDLHPMWVLVGLMIGGNLFGLLGIILAVPVIAIAKVLLGFLENLYAASNFYRLAGLNLLTDQGRPIEQSPGGLVIEDSFSERPRRAVITTAELKSRILREQTPSSSSSSPSDPE